MTNRKVQIKKLTQTKRTIYLSKINLKNYKHLIEEDGTLNYLVFHPMYKYFKRVAGVDSNRYSYFWKSKGLPDENITAPTTSDYILNQQLNYLGAKTRVEFKGGGLKQDKITYTNEKIVNICIVYKISKSYNISSYQTL